MTRKEAVLLAHTSVSLKPVMRPFRNKILCLMVEADSQIGEIIIPDVAKVVTGEAIVVDVGTGVWNSDKELFDVPKDLKVGDRVCIAKYMGSQTVLREEIEEEDGTTRSVENIYVTIHPDNILNRYD